MKQSFSRFPTVAEYFAGIGLVRMGLEQTGWKVVFANDFSEKKHEMYKDFFGDEESHYIVEDIFKLNAAEIPLTDLATCSFPCIDLSLAGNRNGVINGKHSSAFWGFINILRAQGSSAPLMVMVENVPGWLSSNGSEDFHITVEALNNLGYACDVFVMDARRFTAQSRLRVFLVGVKSAPKPDSVKRITARSSNLASEKLKEVIRKYDYLSWTYFDIPEPPTLNKMGLSEIVEEFQNDNSIWWSDDQVTKHLHMMDENHHQNVEDLINKDAYTYRTFFRRKRSGVQRVEVRKDDISGCLRTAIGGSSKQFILRAGKGGIKMRNMTPREYARLQGVPDEYSIQTEDTQALTGFGDAVCVPAIAWISENVLQPAFQELQNSKMLIET